MPVLVKYFEYKVAGFTARQLSLSLYEWEKLTFDPEILETVTGQLIEFEQCPVQVTVLVQPCCSLSIHNSV